VLSYVPFELTALGMRVLFKGPSIRKTVFWLYIGVLIRLWLFQLPIFLFTAQPKLFFLDGLKKL
jgi:hypothetical protein